MIQPTPMKAKLLMKNNNPLAILSVQQLKRAWEIKQAIADLEKELGQFLGDEPTAA